MIEWKEAKYHTFDGLPGYVAFNEGQWLELSVRFFDGKFGWMVDISGICHVGKSDSLQQAKADAENKARELIAVTLQELSG